MAESSLSLKRQDLQRFVGRRIRIHGTIGSWTAREVQDVDDVIESALSRFYGEHKWTFLRVVTSLTTEAEYNTGTIAVASGVVTLTGGTWPTNAANFELEIPGEDPVVYEVDTRDSGTQLTLVDTSLTVSAGATYTLTRPIYDLPDDLMALDGPFTYRGGSSDSYPPMKQINEAQWRIMRQRYTESEHPAYFAMRTKTYDVTVGDRWQVMFVPSPDTTYKLYYKYKSNPNVLTDDQYARGMGEHRATIEAACLCSAATLIEDESASDLEQKYQMLLAKSIERDRENTTPDSMGMDGLSEEMEPEWPTDYVSHVSGSPYLGPW